jgi:uncharacterized protein
LEILTNLLLSIFLFVTSFLAGSLNAIAGGGSFISFPALLLSGVSPINANATNNVVLWIGILASTKTSCSEVSVKRRELYIFCFVSSIGGAIGSLLLLNTSQNLFVKIVPYLLLIATLLFTFGKDITRHLSVYSLSKYQSSYLTKIGILLLQLAIAIYGGYFGGGAGIMILAMLAIISTEDIHGMNALKSVFVLCSDGLATILFISTGMVAWPQAILMSFGAVLGSYLSVRYARKINQDIVRYFVIIIGFSMSLYLFLKSP